MFISYKLVTISSTISNLSKKFNESIWYMNLGVVNSSSVSLSSSFKSFLYTKSPHFQICDDSNNLFCSSFLNLYYYILYMFFVILDFENSLQCYKYISYGVLALVLISEESHLYCFISSYRFGIWMQSSGSSRITWFSISSIDSSLEFSLEGSATVSFC